MLMTLGFCSINSSTPNNGVDGTERRRTGCTLKDPAREPLLAVRYVSPELMGEVQQIGQDPAIGKEIKYCVARPESGDVRRDRRRLICGPNDRLEYIDAHEQGGQDKPNETFTDAGHISAPALGGAQADGYVFGP